MQQINSLAGAGDRHNQAVKRPFALGPGGGYVQGGFRFWALQGNTQVRAAGGVLLLDIAGDQKTFVYRGTERGHDGGAGIGPGHGAGIGVGRFHGQKYEGNKAKEGNHHRQSNDGHKPKPVTAEPTG